MGEAVEVVLNLKKALVASTISVFVGFFAGATPAMALSSGSSGSSLSTGSSSLWDALFPESHQDYLDRITNPLDDSYISIHPGLTPELYQEVFDPPQVGECPTVVALAARGSEQNSQIRPTRYSPQSPWTSNGFEEKNLRAFFGRLEQYQLKTTGASVMDDVFVLGLNNVDYPASLPLSSQGSSAIEFGTSSSSGREHLISIIDRFEAESGCKPGYLLVGYSQGALVIADQEEELIARDQYVGSVYIANPNLRSDDPTVVGHQPTTGGILSSLENPDIAMHTINYCLPGDIFCDRSFEQFSASGSSVAGAQLSTGNSRVGRIHLQYFVTEQPWDEEIFAEVGSWIKEASV